MNFSKQRIMNASLRRRSIASGEVLSHAFAVNNSGVFRPFIKKQAVFTGSVSKQNYLSPIPFTPAIIISTSCTPFGQLSNVISLSTSEARSLDGYENKSTFDQRAYSYSAAVFYDFGINFGGSFPESDGAGTEELLNGKVNCSPDFKETKQMIFGDQKIDGSLER